MAQLGVYLRSEPMQGPGQYQQISKATELVALPPTLADKGISFKESALAQKVAALPEETRELIKEGATKLTAASCRCLDIIEDIVDQITRVETRITAVRGIAREERTGNVAQYQASVFNFAPNLDQFILISIDRRASPPGEELK
jgi:hypothetical protein